VVRRCRLRGPASVDRDSCVERGAPPGALKGYAATQAFPLNIESLAVTAPEKSDGCDLTTWATGDRTTGVAPGEINVMRVVAVDGTRVVITNTYLAQAPEEGLSALQELMASIQIEP
jgi:hypothetical protein